MEARPYRSDPHFSFEGTNQCTTTIRSYCANWLPPTERALSRSRTGRGFSLRLRMIWNRTRIGWRGKALRMTVAPQLDCVAHGACSRGRYTSVLLGEQSVSNADGRGSNPRARACRRGSTEKGACLVNRLMLVRIQSSALVCLNPDGVAELHRTLRRSGPWFKSGSGYCNDRRPCGCAGFARQRSKLQDGVRLLGEALLKTTK